MALEKLDSVDWAGLKHAYGSAADVPDLIRALASSGHEKTRTRRTTNFTVTFGIRGRL